MQMLAQKGLAFIGEHGSGGDYGNCSIIGFEGKLVEIDANSENSPVVAYHENGIDDYDLRNAKEYWKIYRQVQDYFKEPQHGC
jgi:hypothetical protein